MKTDQKPSNFADPGDYLEVAVKVLPGVSTSVSVPKSSASPQSVAQALQKHLGVSLDPDGYAPNIGGRIVSWNEDLSDARDGVVLRFLVGKYSGA